MGEGMKINEQVTVGPQPDVDELQSLQREGFKTIANFRTSGEEEQPLSPDEEGKEVRELGMNYVNIPVSSDEMKAKQVDDFRKQFDNLEKPIYAHCKSGKRVGAFVMMHMACEQGWTGEETLKKAEEMGFECDKPELVDFVKTYVDDHTAVAR